MSAQEFVIGFDISSKTIGITLMDMNGKLIDINYISMPKKSKKYGDVSIYQKVDHFKKEIKKYLEYNIKHIFIEEPLKNGPNINTTIILAIFNGMISNKLYEIFKIEPEHISVYKARCYFFPEFIRQEIKKGIVKNILSFPKNADKKKLVFDKVSWHEPQIIWSWSKNLMKLREENFDMADSYCVTKAGLIKNNYIITI